jgi:hypothetical protein
MMKAFFTYAFGVMALVPWVYCVLLSPMAYFFFDINIWPPIFQRMVGTHDPTLALMLLPIIIVFVLWSCCFGAFANDLSRKGTQ